MQKLLILLVIITQICFASPFDIANDDEEENNNVKQVRPQILEQETILEEDIIEPKIQKIQSFIKTNKAKFILLNIRDGHKKTFTVVVGETIKIQDIDLQLQSCNIEIDDFYHKISIATCLINRKDVILSNDFNLGTIQIKDILLSVDCDRSKS